MSYWRVLLATVALCATGAAASGYVLLGSKWMSSTVYVHLKLGSGGTAIDGSTSWDSVVASALGSWNTYLLNLQFSPIVDKTSPGNRNGLNEVFFTDNIYGSDFGDAVAVTTEWTDAEDGTIRTEGDILLNSKLYWNSYRGPIQTAPNGEILYDLRRVAIHEIGHLVGLNHPDQAGQAVNAIMNSRVSSTDDLQADDILGGQSLYGARAPVPTGVLARIDRPKRNSKAGSNTYFFLGSADPTKVQSVFLVNNKLGRKFVKARGIENWNRALALKPGRNVVTLYVRGMDGTRVRVENRIITKAKPR